MRPATDWTLCVVESIKDATVPELAMQEKRVEVLLPSCNIETVKDGRGGIFTWIPKDPLMEFNMLYFQPGKTRGNHYHPEFNEYFLVVEGSGIMVWKANETDPDNIIHMSKGTCVRTPIGVAHAFYAITPVTAIAMLSKQWDKCDPPIRHMHVLEPPKK
jgi:mannose-6-phosphate isomerase-like protein (cupin superfamily)